MLQPTFARYIGIDYSGSGEPAALNPGVQVFMGDVISEPIAVHGSAGGKWSRKAAAEWLFEQMTQTEPVVVGIDHAFSFPLEKMGDASNWTDFLTTFRETWRTDERPVTKAAILQRYPDCGKLLRLTEQWTSSAKSVFNCNGPGVACSTFAGLPWLLRLRQQFGDRIFFWPFDGWHPPAGKHVVAEVYPSIFHNRYRQSGLRDDALDAYAVAKWFKEMDASGFLSRYFDPPLTVDQKELSRMEGWILGVT